MRSPDASSLERFLSARERALMAARRLISGPIDGSLAHEFLAATEAEGEAWRDVVGAAALSPRSSSRSRRA